jgi:endonuclease/exonuclease/phosphatase family metal-dependent hydrolase
MAPTGLSTPGNDISILAYNVEGLPWPIATGRPSAIAQIERRLRELRAIGKQPQVLMLEEAFTPRAQAIGAHSGYRTIVLGSPAASLFGSGLEIATDLPILDVKRLSYPDCAGLDCLARKGVMLVTVALPDGIKLQIAATHLNAHKASGSDDRDANRAYYDQVDALSRFIAANRNPALPLVVAGDFNTFPAVRREYLRREVSSWPASDALDRAPGASGAALRSGKDRQFYGSGASASISPAAFAVPFGRDGDGTMLSNHVGYMVQYDIGRRSQSPRASHKG